MCSRALSPSSPRSLRGRPTTLLSDGRPIEVSLIGLGLLLVCLDRGLLGRVLFGFETSGFGWIWDRVDVFFDSATLHVRVNEPIVP